MTIHDPFNAEECSCRDDPGHDHEQCLQQAGVMPGGQALTILADIAAEQRCPNCAPGYDCESGIYTPVDEQGAGTRG